MNYSNNKVYEKIHSTSIDIEIIYNNREYYINNSRGLSSPLSFILRYQSNIGEHEELFEFLYSVIENIKSRKNEELFREFFTPQNTSISNLKFTLEKLPRVIRNDIKQYFIKSNVSSIPNRITFKGLGLRILELNNYIGDYNEHLTIYAECKYQ